MIIELRLIVVRKTKLHEELSKSVGLPMKGCSVISSGVKIILRGEECSRF